MTVADEMPLQEVLQALSRTPVTEPQLRAALATTCARWHLVKNETNEAVRHLGHALEMVPDLRPAMRLLYRIYLDRGDVRSAVMYLDQEIRATRHPREAAALYRERGLLVEAFFHDLSAAQQCYQAALKATPRDLAVLRAVERVSLARGDVFWLIANLEAQLDVVQDPGATASVLHDLALLEARHRGDLGLAGDLLLAALELVPGHVLLASDLFRVAEVSGEAELMLQALEIEAESRPPGARAMPLARASMTLRDARERVAALQLLQAAAHEQPHGFSLWRSLEEMAIGMTRYDVALDAVVGQLRAVGDGEDPMLRAELYYRLGRLALFRLDRTGEGLAAMRKALRLNPGHVPALEDTGRFLSAGGMWSQLLELVRHEIASAKETGLSSEEVALAHLRAGQLLEERLGELEGARRHYESAMSIAPHYRPARDRLERLLHQAGDTIGLQLFYSAELEQAKTPARKAFLLSVLAELHAADEDPGTAIKSLIALLKLQPNHVASIQLLARLLSRAGRSRELLKVTEQEIQHTRSPARQAKLLHRAGELAIGQGEQARAREFFEHALEAVDDHQPTFESLGGLLREMGDWQGLVVLMRKELLYAADRARHAAIQLEIATLLATKLGKPEEALVELQALLSRWPRHLPALHAAESLASTTGDHQTLLALLDQHIGAVSGPRTRALLLHRAASIRASIADHEGAIRDLVRALELWPQLGVARARLLGLYEHLGRSRELQAFAESGLTAERGADDRRAMALQLAELTPKPVVAIQYLGAVAEARPEDYVTQIRLARACALAGRSSRQAGALGAALERFETQLSAHPSQVAHDDERPNDDPATTALRYRAARAEEAAGNLDAADQGYATILDSDPGHVLARRGRLRIKDRRREAVQARNAGDLQTAAEASKHPAERAALYAIAAEQLEHRGELVQALSTVDTALMACETYQPAWHTRARILERIGDPMARGEAIATLRRLSTMQREPAHRARALCRAGSLALRIDGTEEAGATAWDLFAEALEIDPKCDRALIGLRRTRDDHRQLRDPKIGSVLAARLAAVRASGTLTAAAARELARLGSDVSGPRIAVDLLTSAMPHVEHDAGLHADLAQAHARLGHWQEVVAQLDLALGREMSPERRAALHYFAGDAREHADDPAGAIEHYLEAGRRGYFARHAFLAAERLAAQVGAVQARVEALQRLVDMGDGPERAASLRALADVHRKELGQPDVAVDLMRELLLLRPTDVAVALELRRLLDKLGRKDEAHAALLASVAHHRAWLRSATAPLDERHESTSGPVAGLLRLFDAMGEGDGVYLSSAVLEIVAPQLVPPGRRCDELVVDPWPLPKPLEGRPLDGFVGDLAHSPALDLLREGVFYLGELPDIPPPRVDLSPSRSLPPSTPVVIVVRALANALGVPQPLVFLDTVTDDGVDARLGSAPALVVGRRLAAAPFGAGARDRLGRALLRLATGGDALHRHAGPTRLLALCVALCQATGIAVDVPHEYDWKFASQIAQSLPGRESMKHLADFAEAFRDSAESFDPNALLQTLAMAEDRAGVIAAADPRPSIELLAAEGQITGARGPTLVGYLLSDDHLSLRHALGYTVEIRVPGQRTGTEGSA